MISAFLGDTTGSIAMFSMGLGLHSLLSGKIPFMVNPYEIDSAIGVKAAFKDCQAKKLDTFLVTANSFGGLNTAIVVKKV
jgi:3-oxoacyl-(acyl-carrier-protein) synthase